MNWHDWLRSNQGVGVVVLGGLIVLTASMLDTHWVYIRVRDGF